MSREKKPKPTMTHVVKISEPDTCSGCYKFLEPGEATKKAKIKDRNFSFCDDECYDEWLKKPSTMFL
jgi:hypothetical protein